MPEVRAWLRRYRIQISILVVVLLVALGLGALQQLTREIHLSQVRAAFHAIGTPQLLAALGLTVVSYLTLTLYDVLALRIIGRPLPWRTAALASFTSYTLSHNLGLSLITGGSARYRVYTAAGLDGPDVARIIAIAGGTFWMGVLTLTGVALLVHPMGLDFGAFALSPVLAQAIGGVIVAAICGAVAFNARGGRRLALFGWRVPLPTPGQALAQLAIASLDLAAAAGALFVLIPGAHLSLLPLFVLGYALAIVAGLITHVPGGIGVFEAVVLAVVPGDKPALLAALVVYRAIYYLLPLALGIAILVWHEGRRWHPPHGVIAGARSIASGMAPLLLSAASFTGGAILLLSGSLPAIHHRLRVLHSFVPLPFIEGSHLAASLVGTGLLLLAPGLYRRLDGAFLATRTLLLAGAVFSLAKGIDYEEAIVCLSIAALLQWTRPAFYRRTALIERPLSPGWLVSVIAVVALAVWVGLFSYKRIDYQETLWWQFALRGDASRFLRASLGVGVLLSGAALWRLLSPAHPRRAEVFNARAVEWAMGGALRTEANLALIGDKRILFSPGGDAFLMYQVRGSSWIVMADPVGPREAWPDLLWRLRAMVDAAQGRLMLYQISPSMLELAIDLGLQIVKYGEEAMVDLPEFTLEGPAMRSLRYSERRAARDGAEFEVVPAASVGDILPELQAISDQWLAAKKHREKGFSLGRFEPAYVAQFDCAVVRCGGRIVAFANIWKTERRYELSVDLMRHDESAPPGTMDFLFVHLLLWGKEQGYQRFTLGLAPMSGIEGRKLAPAWAKAAAILFQHGERIYGFRGLRAYKDKFAPRWEPRYIAGPRGIGLVQALRDLNALVTRPRGIERSRRAPALPAPDRQRGRALSPA